MTGTLGAVIRIREAFRTRTILFDIGVAGPIAGLVALVPALFLGSPARSLVAAPAGASSDIPGRAAALPVGHAAGHWSVAARLHHEHAPDRVRVLVRDAGDGAQPRAVRVVGWRPHRVCGVRGAGREVGVGAGRPGVGVAGDPVDGHMGRCPPCILMALMWRTMEELRHPSSAEPLRAAYPRATRVRAARAPRVRPVLHANSDTDRGSGSDLGIFRLKAEATPLVFVASGFSRKAA